MDNGTPQAKATEGLQRQADDRGLLVPSAPGPRLALDRRIRVRGKFLFAGNQKFCIKGVTYGPFRPDDEGCEYGSREKVEEDFASMAENGFNAVRLYTVPPRWLLDVAMGFELQVMVGLPWEQHVTFLDDKKIVRRVLETVRQGVRACAGHQAVLCYAIGNEIPAPIVRWHGHVAIERFLKRLAKVARAEDPDALFTYVNYPTTEYLNLPFLDFCCFNVYLEEQERLAAYLARLQNLAGEQPLVMAEIGLDSIRNGEGVQAECLRWQVQTALQGGCAGSFLFAWTDEWHRGGHDIEDWAFGLTDRERRPKPALKAVRSALSGPLLPEGASWPAISVVICSYNGSQTIAECLDAVVRLDYPNYEVIVVNDGSTDDTGDLVAKYEGEYRVKQIKTANSGLSRARNVGLQAAWGEIIAYIDDDAYPDRQWLSYLAVSFLTTKHVGMGGPNLAPDGDGAIADCVANSPGGPSHVLRSDLEAEHLPGCNMAFRAAAIREIGGFDPQFWIAGDDVDLCWRLLERGGTLGFSPGAVVWHHRRNRVRDYLRQQRNYGRAEAMLEAKWPEKYNRLGHLRWAGKLYGKGHTTPLAVRRKRIVHGVWGSRLFQPMYASDIGSLWYLTLMPEWYLVTFSLAGFSLLGLLWKPMLLVLPLLAAAMIIPLVHVFASAACARFTTEDGHRTRLWLYLLTVYLHITQPLARLIGRISHNLTPWRRHGVGSRTLPLPLPLPHSFSHWSETWKDPMHWRRLLEKRLQSYRVLVRRGGEHDRWDLQAVCGLWGGARLLATVEEHGAGRQLVRVRTWPRISWLSVLIIPLFFLASLAAGSDQAWIACAALAGFAFLLLLRCSSECSSAMHSVRVAVQDWLSENNS